MERLRTKVEEEIARRERKLRARITNDRIKSIATILQGVVLVLVGVGALRFVLDPAAPDVSRSQLLLTGGFAVAIEAFVLYILGQQKPKD